MMQSDCGSQDSTLLLFAAWMSGTRADGAAAVRGAAVDGLALIPALAAIYRSFDARRHRADPGFEALDELLRSDPTAVVDLEHPLVRGDVSRLCVLQRELQRQCLTTTLRALPVAPRAAFILVEILGLSLDQAAAILGTFEAARTALARARRQLEAYLESRCEHMDPDNLCRCAGRLGIALERRFVDWPDRNDLPGTPLLGRRRTNVRDLFAALPPPA